MEIIDIKQLKTFPKKRGCNIVRNRCLEFINALKEYGYKNEIPLEEAKQLFFLTLGIGDRASVKAYFGSQASVNIRKIQKIARYSTGTLSFKNIELAQKTQHKKGYFELLGLAKIEQRGKTWFMILTNEPLAPELFPQHYEGLEPKVSMENFSLPPILQGKECEKTVLEVVSPNIEKDKQTTTYRMRERNLQKTGNFEHIRYALTHKEEAILNAKPVDSEPDRAKIQWRGVSNGR